MLIVKYEPIFQSLIKGGNYILSELIIIGMLISRNQICAYSLGCAYKLSEPK